MRRRAQPLAYRLAWWYGPAWGRGCWALVVLVWGGTVPTVYGALMPRGARRDAPGVLSAKGAQAPRDGARAAAAGPGGRAPLLAEPPPGPNPGAGRPETKSVTSIPRPIPASGATATKPQKASQTGRPAIEFPRQPEARGSVQYVSSGVLSHGVWRFPCASGTPDETHSFGPSATTFPGSRAPRSGERGCEGGARVRNA